MRRAAKVDGNQAAIVSELRRQGATVQSLATVGQGCPDILVGYGGVNVLMEIKDGSRSPSERRLTPHEDKWHSLWQGRVVVVESPEQAVMMMRVLVNEHWERETKR